MQYIARFVTLKRSALVNTQFFCRQPSSIIVRAVEILVNYLETNYVELPELYVNLGRIREQIFTMLMSMRTDDNYHLGIENNLAGMVHNM